MRTMKARLPQWALLPFALAGAASAGAGRQHDWNETGPAFSLNVVDRLEIAGAANGSALIGSLEGYDYRLSHVRGDGSVAWHAAVTSSEWIPSRVSPEPDGAAVLLLTGPSYSSIARFDASGALQWSSALQGTHFTVGADRIAALSVASLQPALVTAIDRYSGQWRWQSTIPGLYGSGFAESPLVVDSDGSTYVSGRGSSGESLLAKLDPQGTLRWLRRVAASQVVTVRDGRVYVADPFALQALNPADGQTLWHIDECGAYQGELSFVAADPLCASATTLSRHSAASGAEVWHRDFTGSVLGVFGDDVYIGSDPVSFPAADGLLQRLAGSDGALQWQQAMPFPLRGRIWQVSDDLIGIACATPATDAVALHRYRMLDGSLSDIRRVADVPRGVGDAGEVYGGADLFVLGQAPWKAQPALVRRLATDSGSVLWENATTQRSTFPGLALTPNRLLLAEMNELSQAVVRSLDRASGALRWERRITEGRTYSSSSKPPRIVGLGGDDALVSYGYVDLNGPSVLRRVQELQRLDEAAGDVVWKKQVTEWIYSSVSTPWTEPALFRIGEDVLLWAAAGASAPPAMGLQRRFGSDGAPDFVVAAAPISEMARLSVAADAVFAMTRPDGDTLRLVKYSASSGALLWQFDYPRESWPEVLILDLLPLADGDVLVLLHLYHPTSTGARATHLLRVNGDGSGLRYVYRTRMQGKTRDLMTRVVLAANGEALLGRQLYYDRRGIDFLQRFDLEQGSVIGSQAIGLRGVDPFAQRSAWGSTFIPHGDGVLISGTALRSPLPPTRRTALLDLGIEQRGDLALQVRAFPVGIAPGDSVPFAVGVRYTGDSTVTDATLIVELPWQSGEIGLSCNGAGVDRCELQVRHGQIVARFDAAPGAQLELGGTVRMLAVPTLDKSVLRAVVHGPAGLLESDVHNNFRSVPVEGPIFADGFNG